MNKLTDRTCQIMHDLLSQQASLANQAKANASARKHGSLAIGARPTQMILRDARLEIEAEISRIYDEIGQLREELTEMLILDGCATGLAEDGCNPSRPQDLRAQDGRHPLHHAHWLLKEAEAELAIVRTARDRLALEIDEYRKRADG